MMETLKNRRRAAGEGGFTLIELLVVIVILGILAGVVVFAVSGIDDKGEEAACQTDTRTLRTALEANYAQNGTYGATLGDWNGTPATSPRVQVAESALIGAGFLSNESDLHDVFIYDNDPDAGDIATLVEVTVEDAQCGTLDAVAGTPGNT